MCPQDEQLKYSALMRGDLESRKVIKVSQIPLDELLNILHSNNFEVHRDRSSMSGDYTSKAFLFGFEEKRSTSIPLTSPHSLENVWAYDMLCTHNEGRDGFGVSIGIRDYQNHIPRYSCINWRITTPLRGTTFDPTRKIAEGGRFIEAVQDFKKAINTFYENVSGTVQVGNTRVYLMPDLPKG